MSSRSLWRVQQHRHVGRGTPLVGDRSLWRIVGDQLVFCLLSMFRSVIHIPPPTTVALLHRKPTLSHGRYILSVGSGRESCAADNVDSPSELCLPREGGPPTSGEGLLLSP